MLEHYKRTVEVSKIGVLVKDLRPSTMSYGLMRLGNEIANSDIHTDFYVFHEDWKTPPRNIAFPLLQYRNAYGFDGTLVATSIETARHMLELSSSCRRMLYIWDMNEYLSLSDISQLEIFQQVEVIARSHEYAGIICNNFHVTPQVADSFDSKEFRTIVRI